MPCDADAVVVLSTPTPASPFEGRRRAFTARRRCHASRRIDVHARHSGRPPITFLRRRQHALMPDIAELPA